MKVTPEGKVKVLDFGLAKALAPAGEPQDILSSPTLSLAATNAGVILGTAPYMSPEQAKGLDADQRSDIFAFGALLYEMLMGRQAFQGETVTEVIASVLARQPDLSILPFHMNPRVEDLIRRCLEKDVKRRRQAVADIRAEIETILTDPQGLKFRRGPFSIGVYVPLVTTLLSFAQWAAVGFFLRRILSWSRVRRGTPAQWS